MGNIKQVQILSHVTKVDNSTETNAPYAITADAEIRLGEVQAIHNGKVQDSDEREIANFTQYGEAQLMLSFFEGATDRNAVLEAITGFIADVRKLDWESAE